MNRSKTSFIVISLVIISLLAAGCGTLPSEDGPTSAPPTAQPTFTPHPTFTSTPIPYELEVQLFNEEGAALPGGLVRVEEFGTSEEARQTSDDLGKVSWTVLNESPAVLSVFVQGYMPVEETIEMSRGSNQAVITLQPDPKGLQIADVLEDGDTLLYIEDFQDQDEDSPRVVGVWDIVEDADDPGNWVIDMNQKEQEDDGGFDTLVPIETTDFTASYRMRYIDIDYQNRNWAGFYFRDYACDTYLTPDWRVIQLLDFNQNGEWQFPVVVNKDFQDGKWYTITVEAYGSQVDIYVNDAQMGRYKEANSLLREGRSYLSFGNASGTHVQFDDIVIKLAEK